VESSSDGQGSLLLRMRGAIIVVRPDGEQGARRAQTTRHSHPHPLPLFFVSVDSRGVRKKGLVSVDCRGVSERGL
jgi:hypothetical protein